MISRADRSILIGVGVNFKGSSASTPGTEKKILDQVLNNGSTYKLLNMYVKSIFPTTWRAVHNGVEVANGATGPGYPKDSFSWLGGRDVSGNNNLEIYADVAENFPSDTIDVFVEAREF